MDVLVILTAVTAFIALVFAYGLFSWVGKFEEGTDGMKELSGFVREGVNAFLKREYKVMIPAVIIIFIILGFVINWTVAALYIAGALFSALAGFFGRKAAERGSVRTANAAVSQGINQALKIAIRSGAVMGLCTAGFGLLGIGGVFIVLGIKSASSIAGFGLGVSTVVLFGRVSGGIYMNAANAGAVLVEKMVTKIPKGDPRNPARIAGYAGAVTGSASGMGFELLESYAGSIIAAIIIAASVKSIDPAFGYPFDLTVPAGAVFPLVLSAAGVIAAIAGVMFVRGNTKSDPGSAIHAGKYLSNAVVIVISAITSWAFFGNFNSAISVVIGMLVGALTGRTARTYAFGTSRRLRSIIERSQAMHLKVGEYTVGMLSTLWPILFIAAGITTANAFADFYGIALAAVGMLSTLGMTTAIDALGPVSGNAVEIARMAHLSEEAKTITERLDSVGKTNTATGKGFAAAASALTAASLLAAYAAITDLKVVNLLAPAIISGLFIGAMLPILLSASAINSAEKTAFKIFENVKKQFDSDTGIIKGAARPDYTECADMGAKSVLKGIAAPGLTALLAPLAAGIFFGAEVLGGMLAGALISGVLTSVMAANTGGDWNYPEKDSADDPFKDTVCSSVNIFLKLMVMVSVVFASVIAPIGGLL